MQSALHSGTRGANRTSIMHLLLLASQVNSVNNVFQIICWGSGWQLIQELWFHIDLTPDIHRSSAKPCCSPLVSLKSACRNNNILYAYISLAMKQGQCIAMQAWQYEQHDWELHPGTDDELKQLFVVVMGLRSSQLGKWESYTLTSSFKLFTADAISGHDPLPCN